MRDMKLCTRTHGAKARTTTTTTRVLATTSECVENGMTIVVHGGKKQRQSNEMYMYRPNGRLIRCSAAFKNSGLAMSVKATVHVNISRNVVV
jgi:hypothetical protein